MKKFPQINKLPKIQKGAILLEAMIAVLIFSLGILAISGLQAAMIKNTAEATMRAEASYIAQQEIGKMLTMPLGFGTFEDMSLDSSLPDGKLSIIQLGDSRVLIKVTWQQPGEALHKYEAVTTMFTAGR